jgi:thioredoxin reductase
VIGAGPAGLTTAIYAAKGLIRSSWSGAAAGGQVGSTQMMDSYRFDEGISGMDLARRLTNQARRFGVEIVQTCSVTSLGREGQYLYVRTGRGTEYGARAVLVAEGALPQAERTRRAGACGIGHPSAPYATAPSTRVGCARGRRQQRILKVSS